MRLKKSSVICFIGTDGAGKSTLVREVAKRYKEIFGVKVSSLYFGWRPFLPTTKLISYFFKKKGYRVAESMNKKRKRFSLIQELMLHYYYKEYWARYLFKIWPKFYKKQIIVVDRYFYDMYAHYDYANRSKLFKFLIKLFPRPDYVFFLDIDVETAKKRKPEIDIELLTMHRERYLKLNRIMRLKTINTKKKVEECVNLVVEVTKEKIARRLQ